MLSQEKGCLYVNIPSTGGHCIEQFFMRLCGLTPERRGELLLKQNPNPSPGLVGLAHLKTTEYVLGGHISRDNFKTLYKFSFVRNPWDRLVAEFKSRKRVMIKNGKAADKMPDFRSFAWKQLPMLKSRNHRRMVDQWSFIFDEDGKPLVDFIGRFENLQADFDRVCQTLGIAETKLPESKVKGRLRGYVKFYDLETRNLVGDLYRKDIELFKYTFES